MQPRLARTIRAVIVVGSAVALVPPFRARAPVKTDPRVAAASRGGFAAASPRRRAADRSLPEALDVDTARLLLAARARIELRHHTSNVCNKEVSEADARLEWLRARLAMAPADARALRPRLPDDADRDAVRRAVDALAALGLDDDEVRSVVLALPGALSPRVPRGLARTRERLRRALGDADGGDALDARLDALLARPFLAAAARPRGGLRGAAPEPDSDERHWI